MFRVLGPLTVDAVREHADLRRPMVRRLLLRLLVAPGEVVSTDRLVEDLWGDDQPEIPRAALQTTVARLRKGLRAAAGDTHEIIAYRSNGYAIAIDRNEVDAWRFERLIGEAAATPDAQRRKNLCDDALALWRGAPFADATFLEFAQPAIRRLEEVRSLGLEARVEADLELGAAAAVVPQLEEMLAADPLRERTWGLLVLALYRSGRQSDAVAAVQRARSVLAEHGFDLPPELMTLEESVFRRDPGLDLSRLPTPATETGNVPYPATRLIGRVEELARTVDLLGANRLVTLVGPGGSGKSRLATEVAHRVSSRFADGVWRVRLDARGDGEDLLQALTTELAFLPPDITDIESLVRALRGVNALVIFDGCEGFLSELSELLAAVLGGSHELRVLATSRRRFGLSIEALVDIGPLPVPRGAGAEIEGSAVELFLERSRAVRSDVTAIPTAMASIAQIVAHVDGLPLAIELAAAQARTHSLNEIERSLARRTGVNTMDRTSSEHHTSLDALVDYSYRELSPVTQRVFAALSMFVDAFDADAAIAVAAGAGVEPSDAPQQIAELIEWSLLSMMVDSSVGRPTYRMLSTVRDFAQQRLHEFGFGPTVRRNHAAHFCEIVERAEYLGVTGDLAGSVSSVAPIRRSIAEALRWALANNRSVALRLLAAIGRTSIGDLIRPRHWEHLIEWPAPSESRTPLEAAAIHSIAHAAMSWQPVGPTNTGLSSPLSFRTEGRHQWVASRVAPLDLARHARDAAITLGDRVLEIASTSTMGVEMTAAGDPHGALELLSDLRSRPEDASDPRGVFEHVRHLAIGAVAALSAGDDTAATEWIDALMHEASTSRQPLFIVSALHRRACLLSAQSDFAGACVTYERLLSEVIEPEGLPTVAVRVQLGWLRLMNRQRVEASERFDEVLAGFPGTRVVPAVARAFAGRAHCLMLAGEHDRAVAAMRAASDVAGSLGDTVSMDYTTAYEGRLHLAEGAGALSAASFQRGLSELIADRTPLAFAYSAEGMASVMTRRGDLKEAATLIGVADRIRATARAPRVDWLEAPDTVSAIEAGLGVEEASRQREHGEALSTADAILVARGYVGDDGVFGSER